MLLPLGETAGPPSWTRRNAVQGICTVYYSRIPVLGARRPREDRLAAL